MYICLTHTVTNFEIWASLLKKSQQWQHSYLLTCSSTMYQCQGLYYRSATARLLFVFMKTPLVRNEEPWLSIHNNNNNNKRYYGIYCCVCRRGTERYLLKTNNAQYLNGKNRFSNNFVGVMDGYQTIESKYNVH